MTVSRVRAQGLFGTLCRFALSGADASTVERALEAAVQASERVARLLNPFDPDSQISRFNRLAGRGPVPLADEVLGVLEFGMRLSRATAGAYDITMWPLLELWRAADRVGRRPTEAQRLAACASIDYRRLRVERAEGWAALEAPGMGADVSSLAKGYALDCARRAAESFEIDGGVLDAGGQLTSWSAAGRSVDVPVSHPDARDACIGVLRVQDAAVATSGQGQPRLRIEGQPIGHLFDVRTGLPLSTEVLSATVITADGLAADGLSTALFVMGARGLAILEQIPNAEALLQIRRQGRDERIVTPGCPLAASMEWVA